MSHEIYYTSAPEGLKRGTSGFCSVGVSENIPKPLWDRLETLSAYRHEFAGGSGQANPVSLAHWILTLTGKTHHVLSRICDSGLDHTQRTNAFAHHLVLDHAEIAAALGGPAWMLDQPGVMADRWDGKVGTIARGALPRGDIFTPSRVCHAWESATGDAGWGGHLADLFAKTPTRPVCLLFAPGQDVFALVAEAIALLPPAARWNVTFNTYFTSMPTSATCLWRCCLAGTPAAQTGLRYAATGLVLDLTDQSRLPALPAGPYVTMARTGEAPASAAPAGPRAAVRPPPIVGKPPKAAPPVLEEAGEYSLKDDLEADFDEMLEADGTRAGEMAPGALAEALQQAPDAPAENQDAPLPMPTAQPRARGDARRPPARLIRRAEEALEEAEREASRSAQRRRKQVLMLFLGAMSAMAAGTVLVILLARSGSPPETPVTQEATHTRQAPPSSVPSIFAPVDTQPPEITGTPTQTRPAPVQTQVATATSITAPVPEKVYPALLTTQAPLEVPNLGTGLGDRVQSVPLSRVELGPAPVNGLKIAFPSTQPSKPVAPAASATYRNDLLGSLGAQPLGGSKPGLAIRWKSPVVPAEAEALLITFDRSLPGLEIRWHASTLLQRSEGFSELFWLMQNSVFELDTPREPRQQVRFKPFVAPPVQLAEATSDLKWPAALPKETVVGPPPAESLPAGWKAEWYPDWESKDPAQRTADKALQVLKFKKAGTTAVAEAWFLLTFKPGLEQVQSTFTRRMESDQRDLAQFESEVRALDTQLAERPGDSSLRQKRNEAQILIDAYRAALAGYKQLAGFDITFELPDGVRLTTLHVQGPQAAETGK